MSIVRNLYGYANQATQVNTFSTEQNLQATYPPVQLVMPVLAPTIESQGRSIRVSASGQLGTTGSPTFTWSVRLLTSTTWSAGGILLSTTGAVTAAATVTLAVWTMDLRVYWRTLSIGGASTVVTRGMVTSPAGLASPFAASMPASNTALTSATVDNSVTYYLFLSANCGTGNALNLMQLQDLAVDYQTEN